MMIKAKVEKVGYSGFNKCVIIEYQSEPNFNRYAAVAEMLSVKEGDSVWILTNDQLNYKDFNAVAVLCI